MSKSRFDFMKAKLEKDPNDARARYGLAMEYLSQGDPAEALAHFRKLLEAHPDHTAGYYHGGQTLVKLGRKGEALDLFRAGVAACDRKGDWHTKEELQAAIDLLA
jgi:Flp pilus assembly protein TadD